jgi:hypothetical protein
MNLAEKILDELRRIKNVSSMYEYSKLTGISQSTIAAWKRRDSFGGIIDRMQKAGEDIVILLDGQQLYPPPPPPPTYHDLIEEIESISRRDLSHTKGLPGVLNAYLHVFERLDELEASGHKIASKDDLLRTFKPSWWKLEPIEASASDRKKALELLESVAPEAVADALANRKDFVKALKEIRARRKRLFG